MQAGEQLLVAQEKIEGLQAELNAQAKSHRLALEALASEGKCSMDKLQVILLAKRNCDLVPCQLAGALAIWLQETVRETM